MIGHCSRPRLIELIMILIKSAQQHSYCEVGGLKIIRIMSDRERLCYLVQVKVHDSGSEQG